MAIKKIKVEGLVETIKSLERKAKEIEQEKIVALQESGILLKEEIQESIQGNRAEPRSVDTGEFLRSIELQSGDSQVSIVSDVPQAVFMEFGTSKIPERRHFRNSTQRLQPVIKDKFKDKIKRAIK